MQSLNNSTEAVAVRRILEDDNVIGELVTAARYVIAVLAVFINGIIAVAFLVQKCRRPNAVEVSPAGLLVLNLLLADALVGAVTLFCLGTFSTEMIVHPYWCSVRLSVSYLVMTGSHVAVINVVFDRYVAIKCTLHYREWMTLGRSVFMLCCGWAGPVAGAVAVMVSNDWRPGLVRCSDMDSFRHFMWYVWVPSHVAAIICVIVIHCRAYLRLRQYEQESVANNHIFRRFSHKSAKLLFWVSTTFVLCWGPFDAMLIVTEVWLNPITQSIFDVTLVFAQLSFLVNPLMYSCQTANIRRPIGDLCADIKRWGCSVRDSTAGFTSTSTTAPRPPPSIAVIERGGPFRICRRRPLSSL